MIIPEDSDSINNETLLIYTFNDDEGDESMGSKLKYWKVLNYTGYSM